MVNLKIEVLDFDTEKTVEMTLPCNISQYVDESHDLVFYCSDTYIPLGDCTLSKLNESIEAINARNPCVDVELLSVLLEETYYDSIVDEDFFEKIIEDDFWLDKVIGVTESSDEEKCAKYLVKCKIPFAINIGDDNLALMEANPDLVDWDRVWDYYFIMGFKPIILDGDLYVFNWCE